MTMRDLRKIPEHNAERDERGSLNDVKGDRAFPGDGDWRWFVFFIFGDGRPRSDRLTLPGR